MVALVNAAATFSIQSDSFSPDARAARLASRPDLGEPKLVRSVENPGLPRGSEVEYAFMRLDFTKMHSLGNDFVVLDAWAREISLTPSQLRRIADRRAGVGCDQILFLDPDPDVDFAYRVHNADGQPAGQCGNGARCLARYAADRGYADSERQRARAPSGEVALRLRDDGSVSVDMGVPRLEPDEIPFSHRGRQSSYALEVGGEDLSLGAVSMGNPHAVLTVDSVPSAPVRELGPRVETHPKFPRRANVGFMEISTPRHIRLRVWERGVGETPGCGTGACAAVVVGRLAGELREDVAVSLPGGDLQVRWEGEGRSVTLRGSAEYAYTGSLEL